jgi:hypothetical protein
MYWDAMYFAHLFTHRLYNTLDSVRKAVYTDESGNDLRVAIDSNWREQAGLTEGRPPA